MMPGPAHTSSSGRQLEADNSTALRVDDLSVDIRTSRMKVRVVDGVSLAVASGRTLAVVGESGCGKSVTALAIANLLEPMMDVVGGHISLAGVDVTTLGRRARRTYVGRHLGLVFQDALTALNPVYPVGKQIGESLRIHHGLSRSAARDRAVELMDRVGIPDPRSRVDHYPHQFSGGMRQRLVIATAIALNPSVVIADEPTTALDVTIQAQVMDLLRELREEMNIAVVLITHDLALAAEQADDIVVMYAGRVVEAGTATEVLADPRHPYTRGLLDSVPVRTDPGKRLRSIPGGLPDLANMPIGCAFAPRCHAAGPECLVRPELTAAGTSRTVACHHWRDHVHD